MKELNRPGNTTRKRERKLFWRRVVRFRSVYLMLIPVLLYFVVFSFYPLVLGIIQSFQKERLLGRPTFIGLDNYRTIMDDYLFRQAFTNSVVLGLMSMAVALAAAIVLTICVNEVRTKLLQSAIQTATFLPYLFSWTVIGGIWIYILSSNGLVNSMIVGLGGERIGFFSSLAWARPIFIFTHAWKNAGYFVVLLLAGVVTIDPTLYESAYIDGAGRLKQIRYIIIPTLGPTIKTLLVLQTTSLLRNFDQVFVMTTSAIKDNVRSLMIYIYEEGITQFRIGKATAAATVVLLATLLISAIVRKLIHYDRDNSY